MGREVRVVRFRDGELPLDHTVIMGIVNVTPDSFSDGGRFLNPRSAVEHGLRLAEEGAKILDIGGESTRPGASPVSKVEEWQRVQPVLKALREKTDVRISIDTYKPEVAANAITLGADMVNDVRGLRDVEMVALVARERVPVAVMHMKGEPATMQETAFYGDVMGEIRAFLEERTRILLAAGVDRRSILIDPGLGFGKRPEDNTEIVQRLPELSELGFPVLVGASRKWFAGAFGGKAAGAGLAATLWAVRKGADVVRVHDVAATAKALKRANAVGRPPE